MPLETPKVPTGTSTGDITLKEEKEVNLEAEYIDNRSVTISSVHNYSMFRKTNMKVMGQRKDTIGSCIRSSRALSANKTEVEAYFPNIIGISPNNPEFVNRVKQYLNNIQVIVTDEVKLNTTFIYNHKRDYLVVKAKEDEINEKYERADKSHIGKLKQAIDAKIEAINTLEASKATLGYPQNVEEYIIYRHCLLYKDVAKDLSLINSDPSIRFYFKDDAKEAIKVQKLHQEKFRAKQNFVEMMGDDKMFNSMLIQYCVSEGLSVLQTTLKTKTEKEMLLDRFSETAPDKFNKLFNDKNLAVKSFIESLIARGELFRSEYNQNISSANGDFIGANMNEAIVYFNNPNNADVRAAYEKKLNLI